MSKKAIILNLVSTVLSFLSPQVLRRVAKKLIQFIREEVQDSKNTIDDMLVLPLCDKIESAFDLNDEENEQKENG